MFWRWRSVVNQDLEYLLSDSEEEKKGLEISLTEGALEIFGSKDPWEVMNGCLKKSLF